MKKLRTFGIASLVEILLAVVVMSALPYVVIQSLWTPDLGDRIGTVIVVAFLFSIGLGMVIDAFRGARAFLQSDD